MLLERERECAYQPAEVDGDCVYVNIGIYMIRCRDTKKPPAKVVVSLKV